MQSSILNCLQRFSTSSTTSTTQRRMFPPSLPAPPYPTPDLFPVKFQPRRTSAPAVSNRGNIDIDRSCQNKTHHSHIETISSNMYHENLVNSLSPKYSPQSPPQSIIAESVSHSEFNSLLVANENFSSETSFINKMKNDSISKSNLSQLSEESLLTALVRCQNISEDCINSPLNKKLNSNTQQSTNSSSCDIQCSVKLPDPEYLNHELVTNNDNSSKNISNSIVFNGTYSSTLDKKIKKCSNQSSISNNQKLTLFEQSILDKQNLSKVELAKRCWENYFRPKPPRIARKKTLQDDSINQSMNIGSIHGKSFRSNSTDCTFRNYDNKMETKDNTIQQKYNDNLQTTQLQCLSTPLSPILSSNDNISTIDSQCSLKDNINQSDDSITSKYTKKGYSPSFIRLIVANELDNSKQLETNLYDLPRNIEQVNCQHSTSTLTLTEITTPTKEYESRMNSIDSNEINEKRLYQSNIEFTNYDKDMYSEDLLNVIRPQSVTLQRHCIHLIDKHRKLTCTSLNDYETTNKMHLSNKNNLNKNNKNDIIQTLKKYSYPISDSATQTDIHLNKHAHWSRLHVEEDRLIRNINKKCKRHNTFIDHFQLPVEKNVNYIRSYSADYNPLKSYSKYNSLSIVDSAKNCNVKPSDDKNLINSVYSEYDHEDDQFNDKLSKMSLSPAARRYEEHVLATVSGRPYNKSGNQLQFADHKNYVIQQNSIKKVKILPEYHYNNKSIEVIKDSNYDEEESDSVYHQNDEQLNAELWREKLGAITRWRREVDNAMLAGETDLKEIFSSPDNTLHNSFIEKEFNLTHMPNQHDTVHYLQPTSSSINPPSLSDLNVNYSTTYGLPLEQSKNHIKPLVQGKIGTISTNQHGSYQSNNLKSHTHQMNSQIKKNMTLYDNSIQKNYQSTSQTVPSKVVINPSGVLNDHIYHYDNNIHLEKPPQITSQYQPMWIKASKPQASFSRQQQQQQQQQPSFG
ncbi:methionine sulfoxide reductase [Schistosoma japonicum]|nr:methionine sulfoxide reductase [Schistosoma japonicum]